MKQSIGEVVSDLVANIKTYVNSKIDLYLLTTFEKVGKLQTYIISLTILILISFFCLFFITIACAIWIGKMLDNYAAAFLLVGGFYFVIGVIFMIFRRSLIDKHIIKHLIKSLFPPENKNE